MKCIVNKLDESIELEGLPIFYEDVIEQHPLSDYLFKGDHGVYEQDNTYLYGEIDGNFNLYMIPIESRMLLSINVLGWRLSYIGDANIKTLIDTGVSDVTPSIITSEENSITTTPTDVSLVCGDDITGAFLVFSARKENISTESVVDIVYKRPI